MEVVRVDDFGVDVIAGAAGSAVLAGPGVAAVGVAGLEHELVDDAVEEHVVVETFLDEFEEVGLVAGRVAVEAYNDVAFGGTDNLSGFDQIKGHLEGLLK